jgi:hypothetical protein
MYVWIKHMHIFDMHAILHILILIFDFKYAQSNIPI